MSKRSVTVTLAGQQFRVRSDGAGHDPAWLQEVADHVDATMDRVRSRTGIVDTRELALLTALNLAREVLDLRERGASGGDDARVRALADLAQSALDRVAASRA